MIKKTLSLIAFCLFAFSCQNDSASKSLSLLDITNQQALDYLLNKQQVTGHIDFVREPIEALKKARELGKVAIIYGDYNDYKNQLSLVVEQVRKSNPSLSKDLTFFDAKVTDHESLLIKENLLIAKTSQILMDYFLLSDMAFAQVNFGSNGLQKGKATSGRVYLSVGLSTLKNLVEFDIIDQDTKEIEEHINSETNILFDYTPKSKGTKIIRGIITTMQGGVVQEIQIEDSIEVK